MNKNEHAHGDQTRSSTKGKARPRLPHERDESMDTGQEPPDKLMHISHEDAVSSKVPTDRSQEADAAYGKLRGEVPGAERDVGKR